MATKAQMQDTRNRLRGITRKVVENKALVAIVEYKVRSGADRQIFEMRWMDRQDGTDYVKVSNIAPATSGMAQVEGAYTVDSITSIASDRVGGTVERIRTVNWREIDDERHLRYIAEVEQGEA